MTLLNFILYSFIGIGFIIFLNFFINIWVGASYVLDISIPIVLALNFYVEGIRSPAYTYRVTLGLFNKGKFTPYIAIIVNIISSIILCNILGPVGIFMGTILSQVCSYSLIDPYLIFKYEFKSKLSEYILKKIKYFMIFAFSAFSTFIIINKLQLLEKGILGLIISVIIVLVIPSLIYYITLRNTTEYKELKMKVLDIVKKIKMEK